MRVCVVSKRRPDRAAGHPLARDPPMALPDPFYRAVILPKNTAPDDRERWTSHIRQRSVTCAWSALSLPAVHGTNYTIVRTMVGATRQQTVSRPNQPLTRRCNARCHSPSRRRPASYLSFAPPLRHFVQAMHYFNPGFRPVAEIVNPDSRRGSLVRDSLRLMPDACRVGVTRPYG